MATVTLNKVLISDAIDPVCKERLEAGGIQVDVKQKLSKEDLIKIIPEYDGLVVRSATKVTADVIAAATNLKVIGRAGTGVDNIDIKEATKRGVLVMNTPGGNTLSAAEHTCAMLSAVARNIAPANRAFKEGRWDRKKYMGNELNGKTLAILGLGRIGREVASRMQAFGMRTIGYDPMMTKEQSLTFGVESMSLDEIWPQADFITVHTPLIPQTRGLVGAASLAKCKKGVKVINCARGGIVDETDLLAAILSGQCGGAALDVYVEEPPKNILDNALYMHDAVLTTPHLGASTEEAQTKVAEEIAANFVELHKGGKVSGILNAPALNQALKPEARAWANLSERMGRAVAQMQRFHDKSSAINKIACKVEGSKVKDLGSVILASVLVGVLDTLQVSDNVNLINAGPLAEERGLTTSTEKSAQVTGDSAYTNVLSVTATFEDGSDHVFEGTVSSEIPRFIKIDNFTVEIQPYGNLVLYKNKDTTGVLATIARLLADKNINIADFNMGRKDGNALSVLTCDADITPEILAEIKAAENVEYAANFVLPGKDW